MIDFHTHTYLSDGVLGPSELVRRAHVTNYRAIGLADHADGSNLGLVVPAIVKVAGELNAFQKTFVVPGVEITHAPPGQIADLVTEARALGAVLVVVHGESPVEPVAPGTNRAAIDAGADILAHPGLIELEDARRAFENGVFLEITSRGGHNRTNGHVARIARESGAGMVVNTDAHAPGDLISRETAMTVLIGAGLTLDLAEAVFRNNEDLLSKLKRRLES